MPFVTVKYILLLLPWFIFNSNECDDVGDITEKDQATLKQFGTEGTQHLSSRHSGFAEEGRETLKKLNEDIISHYGNVAGAGFNKDPQK